MKTLKQRIADLESRVQNHAEMLDMQVQINFDFISILKNKPEKYKSDLFESLAEKCKENNSKQLKMT